MSEKMKPEDVRNGMVFRDKDWRAKGQRTVTVESILSLGGEVVANCISMPTGVHVRIKCRRLVSKKAFELVLDEQQAVAAPAGQSAREKSPASQEAEWRRSRGEEP